MQKERIAGSVDVGDIRVLAESWRISLQARNLSPMTVGTYTESLESFTAFVVANGMPTLAASVSREHIDAWLADLASKWTPATVRNRYTGVKQFFAWAHAEGEVAETPLRNMSPPVLPEVEVPILSGDQVKALLAACKGNGFEDRRDYAIVMTFLDAGLRLSELTNLNTEDIDLRSRGLTILGKGRKPRLVGLGTQATQAIDRYIRARRSHRQADRAQLWIGKKGAHRQRGPADVGTPRHGGGYRGAASPPAAPLVRPYLVSERRRGNRPDATGRVVEQGDGRSVRRVHCCRACLGGASSP